MYGTIFTMKAVPGKRDEVVAVFNEWEEERKPQATVTGGYLLLSDSDPDALIGVALAPDEATYRANNNTPGQAEWFGKLRALLVDDPEWNDGEILDMQ